MDHRSRSPKAFHLNRLLALLLMLLSTSLSASEIDKVKNDSIRDWITKVEEQKFQHGRKRLAVSFKKYLESSGKDVFKIDSVSLEDIGFDDTLNDFWKHVAHREYMVWAIINDKMATRLRIYTGKDKIDSVSYDGDALESDDWVQGTQKLLDLERYAKASKRFEANTKSIAPFVKKCVQKHVNNPKSVQIATISFYGVGFNDESTYRVAYKTKARSGALAPGLADIKLDEKNKCLELAKVESTVANSEGSHRQ
jgi:hypothetical protein